jgi:hypothetical protein
MSGENEAVVQFIDTIAAAVGKAQRERVPVVDIVANLELLKFIVMESAVDSAKGELTADMGFRGDGGIH